MAQSYHPVVTRITPHLGRALDPDGAMAALVDLGARVIRAIGSSVQDHGLHRGAIDTGRPDVPRAGRRPVITAPGASRPRAA